MIVIDSKNLFSTTLNSASLNTSIAKILAEVDSIPYDTSSIPQERLDLAYKLRTNLFPWRGQFSPELVEVLLERYSKETSIILDPFAGVGTTLFEASLRDLTCYGTEINPSAVEMAKTIHFMNMPLKMRRQCIQEATAIAEDLCNPYIWDIFSYQEQCPQEDFDAASNKLFKEMLRKVENKPFIHTILTNTIIRYMSTQAPRTASTFRFAFNQLCKLIESFPCKEQEHEVFHADARAIPLEDKSIDLIITSPPYINVFNYHQNNRPAMELIGWNLLEVAKSEIGANRKHRQNRFLTVVQYCLDMRDALREMKRVLRPDGRAIIVIGRESTVRGLSFRNGHIVAAIAIGSAGFQLDSRQERKFKNKFGEIIYEDILHLVPDSNTTCADDEFAIHVAQLSLLEAAKVAIDEQIQEEVLQAIDAAHHMQKSPLFESHIR